MQLSKLNEVYLKLEIDSSLSKELANYFTFEVPGAKFMPAFKNRIWDGKIRLFSEQTGKIYVGLLPYIKQYCEKNNITISNNVKYDGPNGVLFTDNVLIDLITKKIDIFMNKSDKKVIINSKK